MRGRSRKKIEAPEDLSMRTPPAPYLCPECPLRFNLAASLGQHLESVHRPPAGAQYSKRGKLVTVPCSMGCGRHFIRVRTEELRAHELSCDGTPATPPPSTKTRPFVAPGEPGHVPPVPVKRKERRRMSDLQCEKCGKQYQRGGSRFETHVTECRGSSGVTKNVAQPIRAAAAVLRRDGEQMIAEARRLEQFASSSESIIKARFQKRA